jgi:hypothetical protein
MTAEYDNPDAMACRMKIPDTGDSPGSALISRRNGFPAASVLKSNRA